MSFTVRATPVTAGPGLLAPCSLEGLSRPARCGTIQVAENPDQPDGRRLAIAVAVIPASSGKSLPDPIALLQGGPGEDSMSAAPYYADQLEALLDDRDLLLVDQRGTGQSNALRCQLFDAKEPQISLRDLFPVAAVRRCRKELSERADLTQYGYTRFAQDLEHIRRVLGYGPLNLTSGSYGTRAAQVFLKTYPQSVRTVHLGSIVPIDVATPLAMAKAGDAEWEKTFAACEADAACRGAFPNLRQEFREVVALLEKGTVRVELPGRPTPVPMYRGRVAEYFRSMLYRPLDAAELPWLVHQAHIGNWQPLSEGILEKARNADKALSLGLLFSITCSEDMAFVREEDVVRESAGTFLGDYRVRQQQAACGEWPAYAVEPEHRAPVRSAVPTLFVSGDMDGGTPLWMTKHAAVGFSQRAEVVLRGRGHTEWADCAGNLYEKFVRSGSVRGLDRACPAIARPRFKTR